MQPALNYSRSPLRRSLHLFLRGHERIRHGRAMYRNQSRTHPAFGEYWIGPAGVNGVMVTNRWAGWHSVPSYTATLNLIASLGAFTKSCLVPRYRSVV